MGLFMDWKLQTDIWVIMEYYLTKFLERIFFFFLVTLDWIKDNALKNLRECIATLRLIETVNYLLLLLLSEFSALQERKYVFKGPYSWYCVFVLFCIILHFNVSFANALHFVCLVWCIKPKCPQQFFIARQFLLKMSAGISIRICVSKCLQLCSLRCV